MKTVSNKWAALPVIAVAAIFAASSPAGAAGLGVSAGTSGAGVSADVNVPSRPNGVTANGNLNFSTLDRDGNGTISHDEYTYSGSNAAFASIDANGDGSISNDELMRFGAGAQSR